MLFRDSGSGVVRSVVKLGGKNSGQAFALKSLSKSALLRKRNGPNSALNELKFLLLLLNIHHPTTSLPTSPMHSRTTVMYI